MLLLFVDMLCDRLQTRIDWLPSQSSLVYHHVPNPLATTLALAKSIRPGGKILVIDFEPMNQQQNDHIMRAMVKLRQEMGEERSEGHHHPHPEHEGHHHHSGHDEGKGGEDKV
jgi:hypothetical protein